MTLVIAGYVLQRAYRGFARPRPSHKWRLEPDGIFFAADSAITDRAGRILLSGFRKVYPVRVQLWEPYFVGEHFRGYRVEYEHTTVAIAFAGSTLAAQHYLNAIAEHLSNLRISCKRLGGPIDYCIVLPCERNPLESEGVHWSDDTFLRSDFVGLLTQEVIAEAVLHSLQHAIRSARKYKLDEEAFKTLYTDFVLGVQCPRTRKYHLYEYVMETDWTDVVAQARVSMREVPHSQVAVLGMKNEFSTAANIAYAEAINNGVDPEVAMFAFLNSQIDLVAQRGDRDIDRPSVLKILRDGALERAARDPGS